MLWKTQWKKTEKKGEYDKSPEQINADEESNKDSAYSIAPSENSNKDKSDYMIAPSDNSNKESSNHYHLAQSD